MMTKRLTLTLAALVASLSCSAAFAADAASSAPALFAPKPADMALYAKLYGGAVQSGGMKWGFGTYDFERGSMFGASFGVDTPLQGVSVELDITRSRAKDTTFPDYLNARSIMGNVVKRVDISDTFRLYGGAGLGVVHITHDDLTPAFDAKGSSFAGQVFAGIESKLTDNIAIFGEARYQSSFGTVRMKQNFGGLYSLAYNRRALLVGLKLSF